MDHIIKENKILIVALDDFDFIKTSKDLNRTLYTLLRAHETYPGAKVTVFTITSHLTKMIIDPNVATVFYPIEIQFPSYTREEMYSILSERCRIGFYKDVISEEIIQEVTNRAYEIGDVRHGLKILTEIGEKTEKTGSNQIQKEHII
jgi:cell division control protein 6